MLNNNQERECYNCFGYRSKIKELAGDVRRLTRENERLSAENERISIKAREKRLKSIPKNIRKSVYERSSGLCEVCGLVAKHIHHKDRDRTNNTTSNLLHLCVECHSREHGRTIPAMV